MSSLEQLMVDHCPNMMMLVDPSNLQIIMANQVAAQTLGYAREALLALSITDIESSLQDVFYWAEVGICKYAHCSECVFVAALIYIDRYQERI